MQRIDYNNYRLSSGRTVYAHAGIFGVGEDDDGHVTIHHGYDGTFYDHEDDELTRAERLEIAAHMIAQWTEYARRLRESPPRD